MKGKTRRVEIVAAEMVSGFGRGIESLWQGLLESRSTLRRCSRFDTGAFISSSASLIPGLGPPAEGSLAGAIVDAMLPPDTDWVPPDAALFLATTVGEVDRLQQAIETGTGAGEEGSNTIFLTRLQRRLTPTGEAQIVSAACASATCAIASAAAAIAAGRLDCALVVAVDAVTEFVYAGFSSLMALSPEKTRPFDRRRDGLSLGEAGAVILLMSGERAAAEGRQTLGTIRGWAMNNDACHLTGPAPDGEGLARAVDIALARAGTLPAEVDSICAHGTGTVYNDAMEMAAFRKVFGSRVLPVYSIKGALGHTLAAAGMVEVLVMLKSMDCGIVPPTVRLEETDACARGYVCNTAVERKMATGLTTNSGFGGINAALVLSGPSGVAA